MIKENVVAIGRNERGGIAATVEHFDDLQELEAILKKYPFVDIVEYQGKKSAVLMHFEHGSIILITGGKD